jgi:hypothetical protein
MVSKIRFFLFCPLQRDRRVREGVCQERLSSSVLSREKAVGGGGGGGRHSSVVLPSPRERKAEEGGRAAIDIFFCLFQKEERGEVGRETRGR